jgi:hypothetical protein
MGEAREERVVDPQQRSRDDDDGWQRLPGTDGHAGEVEREEQQHSKHDRSGDEAGAQPGRHEDSNT